MSEEIDRALKICDALLLMKILMKGTLIHPPADRAESRPF